MCADTLMNSADEMGYLMSKKSEVDTQDINGWNKNIENISVKEVLSRLDAGIALRPETVQPLTTELFLRAKALVNGVDVGNIDLPLPEDDEE